MAQPQLPKLRPPIHIMGPQLDPEASEEDRARETYYYLVLLGAAPIIPTSKDCLVETHQLLQMRGF